jgi:hypothetical protein
MRNAGSTQHGHSTAFLVLSMTLWWYSYDPCEKFMRTGKSSVIVQKGECLIAGSPIFIPASLSLVSVSTLLVFGPGACDASEGSIPKDGRPCTDCADDRGLGDGLFLVS